MWRHLQFFWNSCALSLLPVREPCTAPQPPLAISIANMTTTLPTMLHCSGTRKLVVQSNAVTMLHTAWSCCWLYSDMYCTLYVGACCCCVLCFFFNSRRKVNHNYSARLFSQHYSAIKLQQHDDGHTMCTQQMWPRRITTRAIACILACVCSKITDTSKTTRACKAHAKLNIHRVYSSPHCIL